MEWPEKAEEPHAAACCNPCRNCGGCTGSLTGDVCARCEMASRSGEQER